MKNFEETPPADVLKNIESGDSDAILNAVATQFGTDIRGLTLIPDMSFHSEVDGSASFFVTGNGEMFGVNGSVNDTGNLTNLTVTKVNPTGEA